jgi:hypothetical protein
MASSRDSRFVFDRRKLLMGAGAAGALAIGSKLSATETARGLQNNQAMSAAPPGGRHFTELVPLATANGTTEPYPIPWLDKNGSHNQPATATLEPSHIYHFKGLVARCSTFSGKGTDNAGNRIAFGSPTTDYGLMRGEYWAARSAQQGIFTHI